MKTVAHNGKEYQIGALYEFSNNGVVWFVEILLSTNPSIKRAFKGDSEYYERIREIQNPVIGTINDAPVELEGGCAYQFDFEDDRLTGVYNDDDGFMQSLNLTICVTQVSNIVKLVPEV